MDNHSELGSEDNSASKSGARLLVTHEGLLDPALLRRTEGYMHKKGGAVNARGGFRNWKKRWFVIAPVEILGAQGYELQYYDGPNGTLKGKVGLSEIEILCEAKSQHKSVKYEFQIVLQNGGILELSCDDETEREEWIETLNMITAYLRKVLTVSSMTLDGYDPYEEDDETSHNIGHDIAQNCQAFGPGLFGAEAGTHSQFVVQVHDLVGQQVTRGGMPISATLSNDECLYYLRVVDNDDGTYFCQYMLGRAGKYNLHIRLNDEHDIFGSPFNVEVLPSRTIARYCTAHGEALSSIMANQTQTFTIQAMDGFGNPKISGGDMFEVGVMGPAQLRALTDNADGTYTCTLAALSPSAASYATSSSLMVQVTLHGKPIAGSPFKPIITEDLRALYSSATGASPNPSRTGGASVVSAASTPAASTHSKHAMARPSPAAGTGVESLLGELDLQDAEPSVAPSSAASQAAAPPSAQGGSVAGSVRGRAAPPPPPGASSNASLGGASRTSAASKLPPTSPLPPPPAAAAPGQRGATVATAAPATGGAKAGPASVSGNPSTPAPAPAATATATSSSAAAGAAAGGGGLSRLERSRQRALLAKALAEQSSPEKGAAAAASGTPGAVATADSGAGAGDGARRLSKLEELQRAMASGGSAGASAGTGAASSQGQQSRPGAAQPQVPRPVSSEFVSSVASSLRQGLGAGAGTGAQGGIAPGYPANATQNEIKIWDNTQRAFSNEEVVRQLCSNLDVLRQAYETFADFVEGVQVIKLATSGSLQGGLYKMLELYDVTPTYLSKVEVKVLFSLTLHAQRNLRSPAASAGGGTGLDFPSFLKFLVMISYHALSKTSSYSSLYSTMEAKVEVMLYKWALADPLKLQVVTAALRNAASASQPSLSMTAGTSSVGF